MSYKPAIVYRGHNSYDVEAASNAATIADRGESLTVQSQTEDADINVMMRRMGVTGKMPENARVPEFGDFSGISDYQSALHAVMEAGEQFHAFPAEIRERFDNNPQRMLEFCGDAGNLDEAIKIGLITGDRAKARAVELDGIQRRKDQDLIDAAKRLGIAQPSTGGTAGVPPGKAGAPSVP